MQLNWKTVEGSQSEKPSEIDETPSRMHTYLRRNIERITREDITNGETIGLWQYDEAKLTKAEYQQYLIEKEAQKSEQQRADIDYIALMTGVELEEGNE